MPDKNIDKTFNYKISIDRKIKVSNKRNLNTKNLVNISVFTAASVSLVILLISYTPLLVFPTFRVAFEGIFVKLVGYLFGPFIGVIVGIITELLINFFRPSYVHWAFFLTMILYGYAGGIGYLINKWYPNVKTKLIILFASFFIFFLLILALYIVAITVPSFSTEWITSNIRISYRTFFVIISAFCLFYILTLIFFIFYNMYRKNYSFLSEISTIIIFTVVIDFGITNLVIPIADADITKVGYWEWVIIKLFFSPFVSFFNIAIIYTAVYVLKKIMYEKQS